MAARGSKIALPFAWPASVKSTSKQANSDQIKQAISVEAGKQAASYSGQASKQPALLRGNDDKQAVRDKQQL